MNTNTFQRDPKKTALEQDSMEDFDRLPRRLRDRLNAALVPWSARYVLDLYLSRPSWQRQKVEDILDGMLAAQDTLAHRDAVEHGETIPQSDFRVERRGRQGGDSEFPPHDARR